MIAPFWWIHSTSAAYAAIKYANAVLMALAAVPTYLLARMLVPARVALVAALASLCTTALSYATFILPEVLAYPGFALCSWVSIRALEAPDDPGGGARGRARRGRDVRARRARSSCPAAFAAALRRSSGWSATARSRLRRRWGVVGHVVAAIALVGAFLVLNRSSATHSHAVGRL